MNNFFFKPTPLYREFMILDMIEKDKNLTQRRISEFISVAVSMVNNYLTVYEREGYIKRKYYSTKTVEYLITKKGVQRKKVLNIYYLRESLMVYKSAKENIEDFLQKIIKKGFKRILLYGAGEVAEILLQTLLLDKQIPIEVTGVVDDDPEKQGRTLVGINIISNNQILHLKHDGILISSYTNREIILLKLIDLKYDKKKILHFFN